MGRPYPGIEHNHRMEIVLSLTGHPGERLEGTARLGGSVRALPFLGVMELLACIERLADDTTDG